MNEALQMMGLLGDEEWNHWKGYRPDESYHKAVEKDCKPTIMELDQNSGKPIWIYATLFILRQVVDECRAAKNDLYSAFEDYNSTKQKM